MARRSSRSGVRDPVAFFEGLRPARQACTDQLRNLAIGGEQYRAMMGVINALDAAADLFTKQARFYAYTSMPDMIGRKPIDA